MIQTFYRKLLSTSHFHKQSKISYELFNAVKCNFLTSSNFSSTYRNDDKNSNQILNTINEDRLPTDDPDTFGSLSAVMVNKTNKLSFENNNVPSYDSIYAPKESDDEVFYPEHRWTMSRLKREVMEYVKQNKLKEALNVYTEALIDGGFQFDYKIFSFLHNILMGECAKVGNVQMAFQLFRDMKDRNLTLSPHTFTNLFNACANSSWDSQENLERIRRLRSYMSANSFLPNTITYHSMIKAYGRNGAIEFAFSVVDEMFEAIKKRDEMVEVSSVTFNFLLQACISDKNNGFRYAVLTWAKMESLKIKPSLYTYNLFLKALRNCSIKISDDSIAASFAFLENESGNNSSLENFSENFEKTYLLCSQNQDNTHLANISKNVEISSSSNKLQIKSNSNKNIQELQALIDLPKTRLSMLGGLQGIISQMRHYKVKPDIKTLTELAQVVPTSQIGDVLMLLTEHKITPDIDILNLIMKNYFQSGMIKEGNEVMKLVADSRLVTNIMTWGIQALGANSWLRAAEILREMDALGIVPNKEIVGGFLRNAMRNYDPRYVLRLMEELVRRDLTPDPYFIERVIRFKDFTQKAIVDKEFGRRIRSHLLSDAIETDEFNEYWIKFKLRLDSWLNLYAYKKQKNESKPWETDFKERMERNKERKFKIR